MLCCDVLLGVVEGAERAKPEVGVGVKRERGCELGLSWGVCG